MDASLGGTFTIWHYGTTSFGWRCLRPAAVLRSSLSKNMNKLVKIGVFVAVAACSAAVNAQTLVGSAQAGKDKVATCTGCHGIPGYKASYPEVYSVPLIGGQGAKYIESALHEYKKGDRPHPTMRGIAQSLSDQDIADVAAYFSQVKWAGLGEYLNYKSGSVTRGRLPGDCSLGRWRY